jgi:hypothetical protein
MEEEYFVPSVGVTHNLRRATKIGSARPGIAFLFIWPVSAAVSGSWANGLWIAFIGWFLDNAAVGQGPTTAYA